MPSIRTIESIGLICVAHTETSQQRIPSRIHTYGWCGRACMHVLPLYVCVSKYWSGDLYGRGNTLTCLVALKYSSLVSLQQILQIYFGAQITRKFILSTIFCWIKLQKSHTNWILLPNEYYLLCSQLFRFSCDEWACRSGILFLFMKLLTVSISLAFRKMKPRSPFIQIIKELNWTHSVLTQFDRTNCKMCIHIELAQVDFKPFQLECW